MSIKPVKIPGVGMRNVKTALAAAFCALAYYFVGRSPAFACIGAIFGMGSDMEDSRKNGGNRLFGTLIGGLLGMLLFRIYLIFKPDGAYTLWLVPLTFIGTVILIVLCQMVWVGGVQPGGVVLCILAVVPLMLGVGLDAALAGANRGAESEMRRVKGLLKTRRQPLTNGGGKRIMVGLAGR